MRTDPSLDSSIRDNPNWDQEKKRTVALIDGGQAVTQRRIDGLRASFSGRERNRLFISRMAIRFDDVSGVSGLDSEKDGRVFVKWDYDRDGWIDIAIVNTNRPLLNLFRNRLGDQGEKGQFIVIRFVGGNSTASADEQFSNRDGYGAKVSVRAGTLKILREHRCGEGMAAQNSKSLVVGIGEHELANEITVQWPSGKTQIVRNVSAGSLCTFFENEMEASSVTKTDASRTKDSKCVDGVVVSTY